MNNLLELKGKFSYKPSSKAFGKKNISKNETIELSHLSDLLNDLNNVDKTWNGNEYIDQILISVTYKCIIPKSRRINYFFRKGKEPNDLIRGARFDSTFTKHIFTYYVSREVLHETISRLNNIILECEHIFNEKITFADIEKISDEEISVKSLSKTTFVGMLVDANNVESFSIYYPRINFNDNTVVTLYKTEKSNSELLTKIGIDNVSSKMIDDVTFKLTSDDMKILNSKAGYLISMGVLDLTKLDLSFFDDTKSNTVFSIDRPTNEPTIGVIDTLFDENVYFSEWVDYHSMISKDIPVETMDYDHGTAVTSIIVDGPSINPNLDDNCGRFKVRHFGVCTSRGFSLSEFLIKVESVVKNNPDIKIWNISLGSSLEISRNFISPAGALLDKLQCEYDILFVVSGTNLPSDKTMEKMLIGAPADSLNSIVVNSVNSKKEKAIYARKGPVLSFFNKPDVSYYGGDKGEMIRVCKPLGEDYVMGTSFAAPWIARKLAFMIHKLGLTREVAKALLIDSAAAWNNTSSINHYIGYGVVPIKIDEIVGSRDDEIKFYLTGKTDDYETYTYNIPMPTVNDKFPFKAKATLCYFPRCDRNQGVDYTETEMDIHFGRVTGDTRHPLKSINNNKQDETELDGIDYFNLTEANARELYRKWDNIKHINETLKSSRSVNNYNGLWGLSIKTKDRVKQSEKEKLIFGVVITFREINGINRINEFIQMCQIRGWLVNSININNQINIYNKAETEIKFE